MPEAVLAGVATLSALGQTGVVGQATLPGTATVTAGAVIVVEGRAYLGLGSPDQESSGGTATLTASVSPNPTVDLTTAREPYRAIIVDSLGNRYAELENAVIGSVSWELNAEGSASFELPTTDSKIDHCSIPDREVQIWRGSQLLWWGVLVRGNADSQKATFQAVGLPWYFKRRYFGDASRTNYINNYSFEDSYKRWHFTYWPVGSWPKTPPTHSTSSVHVFHGTRALRLSMTTTGHNSYAYQFQEWTVPSTSPTGDVFTVTAWVFIPSSVYVGPAYQKRGLMIQRRSTTVLHDNPTLAALGIYKPLGSRYVPISGGTPKDRWVRMETSIRLPYRSGATERIQVRLYPPNGVAYWDQVTLTVNEKTAFYNTDQATIVKGIVEHAQSTVHGKSDLNITTSCPATGVKRDRIYQHADHGNIREALDEFPTLAAGLEWDVEYSPATRVFKSFYPRKGVTRKDVVLELGRNAVAFAMDVDGEETANSIVVLGDGQGSDREEAGAKDAAALGGLILEKVYNATPGSAIQSLSAQARRGLTRYKNPVTIPQVVTTEAAQDLIGVLKTGDIITVRGKYGWIDVDGQYRIIRITLDTATDQMTLDLNPAATSF